MKKKIPLVVLETLAPFLEKNGDLFKLISNSEFLLCFHDKDEDSDFYFIVESYRIDKDLRLVIDFKPQNKHSVESHKINIPSNELESRFLNWIGLLEAYERIPSLDDDPIVEKYENDYYSEFEIVDEDAEIKPFGIQQIFLLDKHLEYIEQNVENHISADNKEDILDIKRDVILLRENLTKNSKKWVIKKLSRIWAKITKQGLKLAKEFVVEGKKELFKNGAKFIIDNVAEILK